MARRKKRQSAPPRSGWNRTLETLEQRLVMSAAPLMTHHGMGAGFDEIPSLGHHAIVDEPAMTHHAIIDEPGLSHHALPDEPGLSHHDLGPSLGTGVIEASPAVDPEADFWLDRDLLDEADLGEKISQTLREAHGLTGQDEVLSKYGFDGAGQTVVVIDSGIAHSHTALGGGYGPGHRIVGGWDFTENDADFYDDGPEGSHGTHVAGIIGAEGTTHSGVATGVDLVGLRVFDDAGNGYFSWVEDALQWTVANIGTFEHDITAVNLSLGTYWNSDSNPSWAMLEDEFAALEAAGVFISVSAGNDFTDFNAKGVSYPASSDHVIPVMSVDNNGNLSYFSQRAEYAIAAPGRAITSTVPDYAANDGDTIDDDWQSKSGTSMAAPYVAGSSVLVREAMEFVGMTDIDQWDIYDHMMATADTFYDSATNTNYQRLNLEAAIDALMPEDDFGSSVETAHNLGTLNDSSQANPLGSLAGVISTLDDADFFTFTAGATGTVTFSATESHGLDRTWGAWGGAWSTTDNGDCVINVVAGQTYTVSLSTADGLGYYDLNFDLESSFAAIDWGAVATQETQSGLNVSGEAWYSVTAGRTGYLTVESLPVAGSATVEVYDAQQNLVGSAGSRVDVDAGVGEQFMLRVVGESADFDLRLTNAITLSGSTVNVVGTAGEDVFDFTAGAASHTVALNGVSYSFDASQVSQFSFGGDGSDRAFVRGGAGDDVATFDGAGAVLAGDAYSVTASGFDYLNIGGGNGGYDRVDFQDTAGDDVVTFRPEEDDAFMTAGGVFSYASGFERVNAYATNGGYDRVDILDTSGDDHVTFRPEENDAFMTAGGVFSYASGFERVNAYATSGGHDRVDFLDTAGDDHLSFRPEENDAFMTAAGVFSYASGFERVNGFSTSGGYDRVDFLDTAGNDHLTFRPEENDAFMSAAGVFSYAIGFERVHGYATSGGYDRVDFLDTAGNDHLTFRPEENDAFMSAAGVFSYATGFERVHGYATSGGYDRVDFLDTAGDDNLSFRPEENDAFMSAAGIFSYANGFERTNGYATSGGYDRVDFLDTSGNDHLTFRPEEDDAFMSAAGVFSYASGFERTNGYATSGGYDRVDFYDTSGSDHLTFRPEEDDAFMNTGGIFGYASGFERTNGYATNGGYDRVEFLGTSGNDSYHGRADENDAYMASAGHFGYAIGFDRYDGHAGTGGSDTATLDDSSGDDHLDASGSTASLAAVDAAFNAYDFDSVSANSLSGGSDTTSTGSIDYLLDLSGAWT